MKPSRRRTVPAEAVVDEALAAVAEEAEALVVAEAVDAPAEAVVVAKAAAVAEDATIIRAMLVSPENRAGSITAGRVARGSTTLVVLRRQPKTSVKLVRQQLAKL